MEAQAETTTGPEPRREWRGVQPRLQPYRLAAPTEERPGNSLGHVRFAVIVVASIVLAGVFAVSGTAKARDVAGTTTAARSLGVPASLARLVARLLPMVELALAAALVVGLLVSVVRRVAAIGSVMLLGAFTVAMARTLRQGQAPMCRCFGALGERPISTETIVRNIALAALAVVSAIG